MYEVKHKALKLEKIGQFRLYLFDNSPTSKNISTTYKEGMCFHEILNLEI